MEKIPPIIHQTWKDHHIPAHFEVFIQSWKETHPGWEYRLWTDEQNREFIQKYHPDFLTVYDNYPYAIQRVDAIRYFILYEIGGVFIDLDFECLTSIEPLLAAHDCVFGIEPREHCERFKKEMIICNAFMACNPKNAFFKSICSEVKKNKELNRQLPSWLKVLETTGPFKLTEIYDAFDDKHTVCLLPSNTIYPLTLQEVRSILNTDKISEHIQSKIDQAFAVHYFWGNWWEK